jgi:hypothetical protein
MSAESFVFWFAIKKFKEYIQNCNFTFRSYRCETWSLTLREEHRLGVLENGVLRRIFGPKRDELTRVWRKPHNEELHDLYSPTILRVIKSRKMRWAEYVAWMKEGRGVYRF